MNRQKALQRAYVAAPPGPLTYYLAVLRERDSAGAEQLERDIAKTFSSDEGVRVLLLLRDSVLLASLPADCPGRALREHQGQRNLVAELQRLAAYGR